MSRNVDEYIKSLKDLRNNRRDEIPGDLISSADAPNNKYKVRAAFINTLVAVLENINLTEHRVAI